MTFAEELRKAMKFRGVRNIDLARAVGLSPSCISDALTEGHRPRLRNVDAMAEFLEWPNLRTIGTQERSGRCRRCKAQFISQMTNRRRVYCSIKCQQSDAMGRARRNRNSVAFARLKEAREAIAAFCQACEPADLICRDGQCPLRAVSPLPFIPMAEIRLVTRGVA